MKKIKILVLATLATLFLVACYNIRIKEHKDWQKFFDEANAEGCFEYVDNNKEIAHYYNLEYCSERYIPGKTFHILLATKALDQGLAPDELYTITWKDNNDSNSQEKSMTLSDAFQSNNATYFKLLAQKLGYDNVKQSLDTIKYGNNTIDSNNNFWQNGMLLISPDEQVGFIKKLYHSELPYSERAQRIVKNMMLKEKGENYSLHYIASFNKTNTKSIFWIVGYVEKINILKHIETKEDQYIPHPYFFTLAFSPKNAISNVEELGEKLLSQLLKASELENDKK